MKPMKVLKVNDGVYKGILMCKANESSSITSATVTLDDGSTMTMVDGSVIIEVDTNARHILYRGVWYKKQ